MTSVVTLKVFCNFLVPQSDISLCIVNNGSQFCIATEVDHKISHTLNTAEKVDDSVLGGLLVESAGSVLYSLPENSGKSDA
jgi:hypothetical protein